MEDCLFISFQQPAASSCRVPGFPGFLGLFFLFAHFFCKNVSVFCNRRVRQLGPWLGLLDESGIENRESQLRKTLYIYGYFFSHPQSIEGWVAPSGRPICTGTRGEGVSPV